MKENKDLKYYEFKKRWDAAVQQAVANGFTKEQAEYLIELRSHIEDI